MEIVEPLDRTASLAAGNAYLYAVEVILDKPGLGDYLEPYLADGVHNVRLLTAVAHSYSEGDSPSAA